ncbi:SDR family oxidoreductase [Daejeonella sp. JGW-45]|uniref:SDR family oxidoreductase n=1 Tax=Daejeonella sp. JGW-45 TaxID=3034148 RepID=UPI0023EAAEBB|nr:SDR family oxidoreductase [Daejeonella sp. JGW-45]
MKGLNTYWKEKISGKRVLITGGTTGIGREIVLLLISFGARCIICGRHQAQIDETIAEANSISPGAYCLGVVADLSKNEDIENIFHTVDNIFGGIDILINNAALGYGSIMEGDYEKWSYTVQTNLLSYMACTHHAATRMKAAGSGHILNIGSMSADVREEGSSVYVATKSGIQGFSEALRKELNPDGIKVTLIEPGATDTDMQEASNDEKLLQVAQGEMLKAEDIAMAVAFCLVQPDRCDIVGMQIRPHLQLI